MDGHDGGGDPPLSEVGNERLPGGRLYHAERCKTWGQTDARIDSEVSVQRGDEVQVDLVQDRNDDDVLPDVSLDGYILSITSCTNVTRKTEYKFEGSVASSAVKLLTYLSDRSIQVTYAGAEARRDTNIGCIQGSTCGPLLWNVQMDPLLQDAENLEAHLQAFADDILIIACGKTTNDLERKVNLALDLVSAWGKKFKMKFAAHKTQAVIITKKRKYEEPIFNLLGTPIKGTDSIKFLGLTIDRNLSFRAHLANANKKAINIYKRLARTIRTTWGLNPEITRMLYLAVIEPIVLYGAGAWASVAEKQYAKKILNSLTRTFCLKICRAHRTTSLISSALIARVLPLDLRLMEQGRLYEIKRGKPLKDLPGRKLEKRVSPFSMPHPAKRLSTSFGKIESQADVDNIPTTDYHLYTDGSKIEGKVGAAVTVWKNQAEVQKMTMRLGNHCSVYQAELVAILRACTFLAEAKKDSTGAVISDSRSALEAICDPKPENPIAAEIHTRIHEIIEKGNSVILYWIKAHAGIAGNERADELAKQAALKSRTAQVYDDFPLSYAKDAFARTLWLCGRKDTPAVIQGLPRKCSSEMSDWLTRF
ncbi:reverse transcriptase (RNA-dependent DNA polymerase) domain-containing protein [Phthorimaea operculella]|nr:reverse transcriptase (RNA-dependent DNA polymerase) domain-containing protein [Phthorimaea operculella]